MKIYVTSLEGRPVNARLEAMFGEAGGSIGRSDTNTLILPDLQRVISRVHARIEYRGGGFVISNVGSNPITVRGRALAQGETVPLFAGDELVIGSYSLTAQRADVAPTVQHPAPTTQAPQPQAAPFAMPAAAPVAPPPPMPAPAIPAPAMPAAPAAAPGGDPLGLFGAGVAPLSDANPFADLLGGAPSAPPAMPLAAPAPVAMTPPVAPPMPEPAPLAPRQPSMPPVSQDIIPATTLLPSDPFGGLGGLGASAPSASPFADIVSPASAPSASPLAEFAAPAPMMSSAPAAGVIPDDFDPFADPLAPLPTAPVKPAGDFDIVSATQPAESNSIDALFGLGAPSSTQDPFAGSALGSDPLGGSSHSTVDPLLALSGGVAPAIPEATVGDRVLEIHGAFVPPPPSMAPAPPVPPAPVLPADPDMFFSWENPSANGGISSTTILPRNPAGTAPLAPTPPVQPAPPPALPADADFDDLGPSDFIVEPMAVEAAPAPAAPLARDEPVSAAPAAVDPAVDPFAGLMTPSPAGAASLLDGLAPLPASPLAAAPVEPPAPPPVAASAPFPSDWPAMAPAVAPTTPPAMVVDVPSGPPAPPDALARAFLVGLGMQNTPLPVTVTPEFMQRLGSLLREATQGTLDLLMARAMTKREVRADATIIVSRNNNPLKFSPDIAIALTHLVAPQGRGFLTPEDAMRDAYEDLRSHQFGFMAGLRAALADVLKRFDPAVLEQRLSKRTMLDNMLSINRRAKLWDLYTELYREIASEAEEDFHTLFGREFVRAYEEQVARLKDKQG